MSSSVVFSANDGCLYIYDRQRDDRILRVCCLTNTQVGIVWMFVDCL